ncbi:MAG: thiolase family protein, partial [Proteobacteria bacterium]
PFGPTVPSLYALIAQRYMHEFGLTGEDLARLWVLQRKNALLHENGYMKKALSIEEALGARMIASPLRLFDCAPVCDGAGALLITSLERARELAQPVIAVLGAGESHDFHHVSFAPSWTRFGGGRAARKALAQAGIDLSDIDVAQIYDCFSITLLITLADIGFFPHGEAGSYLRSGAMALGGSCPVNTHGGLLSHGHPGRSGGLFHIIEAVRQLRGNAGRRQVSDAELALVHGTGGVLAQHTAMVLGRI